MYGWHGGGWGILWMVLSWGVLAAIVVLVFRSISRGPAGSSERAGAGEILDERFARGEISEDEYRERKRVLQDR
jgi:putative membrane protein